MFGVDCCATASVTALGAWYISHGQQIQQIFTVYVLYFHTVLYYIVVSQRRVH